MRLHLFKVFFMRRRSLGFFYLLLLACQLPGRLCWAQEATPDGDTAPIYEFWPLFGKMIVLLSLMLGALIGASWLLKKLMNQRLAKEAFASSHIQVLERKSISAKSTLYLLRVGSEELLVSESAQGISSLAHWKASQTISNPS